MLSLTIALAIALPPKALVVYDANADRPTPVATSLIAPLRKAGYVVESVSSGRLQNNRSADLVVLTRSDEMPARLGGWIERFLDRHGKLIALRGPAWRTPLMLDGDKWVSKDAYAESRASAKPGHPIVDFASENLSRWERTTDNPGSSTVYEFVPSEVGPALHARIADLTSWDTLISPPLSHPFVNQQTVTQFAAKGDERTRQLAVEWREIDGSRWIGTVPLTTRWRLYRMPPSAFHYWPSVPSGDALDPPSASRISFGLAFSHTGTMGGSHEFWVANVGAAPAGDVEEVRIRPVDGLFPSYKYYRVTQSSRLVGRKDFPYKADYPTAQSIWSVQPRARGVGFDRRRPTRWIPLIEARSTSGFRQGFPAALMLWPNGTAVAGFGVQDEAFYRSAATLGLIQKLAQRLREGSWLLEGGASAYTIFPDQSVTLGATLLDRKNGSVRIIAEHAGLGKEIVWRPKVANGRASLTWLPEWGPDLRIKAQLLVGGKVVDEVSHRLYAYRPTATRFVTAHDGDFWLDGKVWRAHGVNYMPSSGIGLESDEDFEFWLDRRPYDPEVTERDLRKIRELGLNAVSAFIYGRSVPAGNLLDFLRICRSLGLKVNLSLRPGTPLDFQRETVTDIIRTYRLRDDDAVFAYDLAWEPSWGDHAARRRWDPQWAAWLKAKRGSIEGTAWGVSPPSENGLLTNPTDEQLTTDGPHRRMVADYRRFLDDLLAEKYGAAREFVRSLDPNHLVSFRMWEAGNPTYNWSGTLPYDLPGPARSTDFLAPEGYGRIGGWEQVRPGLFEVAYARSWNPALPVLWAEAGQSALDASRLEEDPDLPPKKAAFYSAFYRMLIESRSNGIFWWWYPGGVRVNERSDYGIVNPDGSDRRVTEVIRSEGAKFLSLGPTPKPTSYLEFDRDADARGVFGVYERLEEEFWRRVESGERVGLRSLTH